MRLGWDLLALALLLAAIALAWCQANAKWSAADWALPPAYGDRVHGDVLQHLAFFKAAKDGDFVPFRSKIVPRLGAPEGANWNDWPIVEEFQVFGAGLLARAIGLFATLNVALLLGHLLAATAFYAVARHSRVSVPWAFAGGLAYGLAPFLFAQSPHHPFVQWCWHVPLFLPVWRWVATEPGIAPGGRRFWFGVVVALLAGFQMVYYTAIFCQLVALGALVAFLRARQWRPLLSAFVLVAATALAFSLMNLDTWEYRWAHGPNPGALDRPFKWLEIYALSVTNLFVPPLQHHWELFRAFAERHAAGAAQADEGSYLGLAGLAAFLFLAGMAVAAVVRRQANRVPLEAWQALWIVLAFSSGGFNTFAGLFGFTFLRAGCRYSVVLLAIALLFAAQRLSAWRPRRRWLPWALAGLVAALVWWDQTPRPPDAESRRSIAEAVASDRKFVAAMEAALPAGATVFQVPVMDYPESPLASVPAYEPFRPYLYSEQLRFSFGTNKGRSESDNWPHSLEKLPLAQVVAAVKARGFSALWIDRKAYPENSAILLENLEALGCGPAIESDAGDQACVLLK
jgi:phosphoglycerol transferase